MGSIITHQFTGQMTPQETEDVCGFALMPGHFSTRIFRTDCIGGELFALVNPVFYLAQDGRLFQMPHGAQSDGISAPAFAAAFGRGKGGVRQWHRERDLFGWWQDCRLFKVGIKIQPWRDGREAHWLRLLGCNLSLRILRRHEGI